MKNRYFVYLLGIRFRRAEPRLLILPLLTPFFNIG